MNRASTRKALASIAIPQLVGGGAEKITMNIAKGLQETGLLSRIYTSDCRGADAFDGMNIVPLPGRRALASAVPFAWKAAQDDAGSFLLTLGAMNFAPFLRIRRRDARIVLRVGSIVGAEASFRSFVPRQRYLAAIRTACRAADVIVVQGMYMRDDLLQLMPACAGKVRIIYNFVEQELWTHSSCSVPLQSPYIFIAAGYKPEKGFDILIPAYARSAARGKRKLVVAGVMPDDAAFSALLRSWHIGPEEVIRLGYVPRPYDWIYNADLCVLPSKYEGFSNFLLECGALGKKIVATTCFGGNEEFFRLYRHVTPVGVSDVEGLAAALAEPRIDLERTAARKRLFQFARSAVQAAYVQALFN